MPYSASSTCKHCICLHWLHNNHFLKYCFVFWLWLPGPALVEFHLSEFYRYSPVSSPLFLSYHFYSNNSNSHFQAKNSLKNSIPKFLKNKCRSQNLQPHSKYSKQTSLILFNKISLSYLSVYLWNNLIIQTFCLPWRLPSPLSSQDGGMLSQHPITGIVLIPFHCDDWLTYWALTLEYKLTSKGIAVSHVYTLHAKYK